jgi:hypothetical protein
MMMMMMIVCTYLKFGKKMGRHKIAQKDMYTLWALFIYLFVYFFLPDLLLTQPI